MNMDAVHWKKVQRVVPWLLPDGRAARARVRRARRVDDRRDAVDGLHPLRRVRVRLPVAGGGPAVHRAGRAREGVPLRRRPARRPDRGAPAATSPRTRTASTTARTASAASRCARRASRRWTRSCACAAAPRATTGSTTRTTAAATSRRSRRSSARRGILDERKLLQDSFGAGSPAGRASSCMQAPADRPARLRARQDHARRRRCFHEKLPGIENVQRIYDARRAARRAIELNLYIVGEGGDEEEPAMARRPREDVKVAYWPGCVSRGFTPELHGSMALVARAARHRAGRARPRQLLRRRRDRRAQPGAGRHAQRAHVRDGAEDGAPRDDEHLLDLPGRAVGVPGAARRGLGAYRDAHQRGAGAPRASRTRARRRRTRTSSGCSSRTIGLDAAAGAA